VKLVYENRGEKLGIARLDLNDRIADAIAKADLDPDKEALLEKLLGRITKSLPPTTGSTNWQMTLLSIARHAGIRQVHAGVYRQDHLRADVSADYPALERKDGQSARLRTAQTIGTRGRSGGEPAGGLAKEVAWLNGQARWMEETIIEIIISEGQNEVADFKKWGVDIIPHRLLMKQGFETPDGKAR